MLEACCLIVSLSHIGCLAEFCIYQVMERHDIRFLHHCVIYLYVVSNAARFLYHIFVIPPIV